MAHILIVEDEKSISDLIAMNLALVSHSCEQAEEGKQALVYLKENTYSLISGRGPYISLGSDC